MTAYNKIYVSDLKKQHKLRGYHHRIIFLKW